MARYKLIQVTKIAIDDLKAGPKRQAGRTPNPRDLEIERAINEALASSDSLAVRISLKSGGKVNTLRGAAIRVIKRTGAKVYVGTHRTYPDSIFITREPLSKRGRRNRRET